jgi:predicted N-acyltransferase
MSQWTVQVYEQIADIPQLTWDSVIQAADAPVFYRWDWLRAFELAPIEQIRARRYFVVGDHGGALAVLPAYCTQYSPFWHAYEIEAHQEPAFSGPWVAAPSMYSFSGGIPMLPGYDQQQLAALIRHEAMRFAAEQGCQALGLLNIPEGAALLNHLQAESDATVILDTTHVHTCQGSFETYLESLSRHARQEFKRRRRRADERGLVCKIIKGAEQNIDLDRFYELTIEPTKKHHIPALYDLPTLQSLAALPCATFFIGLHEDKLLGGFLCFEDESAIYAWNAAVDYEHISEFNTYSALMYDIMAYAYERNKKRVEFGRGNSEYKSKHGFESIPILSLFFLTSHADNLLAGRLEDLHVNSIYYVEQQGGAVHHAAI